ncbi:MAG TPA: hypothetical protein VGS05_12030 [Candidatus Sulfotelmatobacter sp.]|nr:hypothetical protein [Candidatus Sulfotelmatobacter sp.]
MAGVFFSYGGAVGYILGMGSDENDLDDIIKNTRELLRHSREVADKTEEMLRHYEELARKIKQSGAPGND